MSRLARSPRRRAARPRAILKLAGRGAIVLTFACSISRLGAGRAADAVRLLPRRSPPSSGDRARSAAARECEPRHAAASARPRACARCVPRLRSAMPVFRHGDVEIAFLDEGQGEPARSGPRLCLLKEVNWVQPGWSTLKGGAPRDRARQPGARRSSKLYDRPLSHHPHGRRRGSAARSSRDRAGGCHGLFHGGAHRGFLALRHPDPRAIARAGGLGFQLTDGIGLPESIADALVAPSSRDVVDPNGLRFARLPSRPARIEGLSPPASGARARPCRPNRPLESDAGADRGWHQGSVAGSAEELAGS